MTQNDPTDHALAAIASIFDHPESDREPEKAAVEEKPIASELLEADGYSKVGPGPIATIRFRWTARRDEHGEYYVDETIGENSVPVVSGPMTNDAAIRFIDARASEARQRFDQLKGEMSGPSAAADLLRKNAGKI